MPSDYDRHVFIAGCGMAFPGFGLPTLELVLRCRQRILSIFGDIVHC